MKINLEAETFAEALGLDMDEQQRLMSRFITGGKPRIEVLDSILNTNMTSAQRVGLLIEFGTRLALDEATFIAEEHEKYAKQLDKGIDLAPTLDEE